MKKLIFIVIVSFGFTGYSQKSVVIKSRFTDKLSYGISFSPGLYYRYLKPNGTDDLKKFDDFYEIPRFSFESGINFHYALSKIFEIEIGASYSDKGYTVNTQYWWNSNVADDMYYLNYYDKIKYNFRYIDVPLKITYKINTANVVVVAGAGLSFDFLICADEIGFYSPIFYYQTGWTKGKKEYQNIDQENCSKFNLSPIVFAGIRIPLSKRFDIQFTPEFQYGVLNFTKHPDDNHLKQYLWSGNLNLSLIYKK